MPTIVRGVALFLSFESGLELDCRCVARRGIGFEISVVHVEAEHVGPDAVGKLTDVSVVGAKGIVVTATGHADAVFCAGKVILQSHELIAGTELRVVFCEGQQATEGRIEGAVGRDLRLGIVSVQEARPGVGNIAEDSAFFLGESLDGFYEIWDEGGAAL